MLPHCVTADSGYFSVTNVRWAERMGTLPVISVGKHHNSGAQTKRAPLPGLQTPERLAMRAFLDTTEGHAVYARRKATVEPVIGQIRTRGFRQMSFRGLFKNRCEWMFVAAGFVVSSVAPPGLSGLGAKSRSDYGRSALSRTSDRGTPSHFDATPGSSQHRRAAIAPRADRVHEPNNPTHRTNIGGEEAPAFTGRGRSSTRSRRGDGATDPYARAWCRSKTGPARPLVTSTPAPMSPRPCPVPARQ
jgi:hypothetical protein